MTSLLSRLLDNFHKELLHELEQGRETSDHPVIKGDSGELAWRKMLGNNLPQRYKVDSGIVVDSNGKQSEQIDLIIYDRQYSPFIFQNNATKYIPAESVYAIFEIKQKLNKDNLEYAQKKIASVRQLHRTSMPIKNIYGKSNPVELPYIHGGLLCYESDWKSAFGQPFEKCIETISEDERIDFVCAAKDGLFEISSDCQIRREENAVTFFFFRLIYVLQQKGTVPMMDVMAYAKWLDKNSQ